MDRIINSLQGVRLPYFYYDQSSGRPEYGKKPDGNGHDNKGQRKSYFDIINKAISAWAHNQNMGRMGQRAGIT